MQLKLGLGLRHHRHHAGVVGAGREFGEPDVVALHEELDAEDAEARAISGLSQGIGHGLGHLSRTLEGGFAHRHGLPGFDVVAVLLAVPDRRTEARRDAAGRGIP